MVPLFKVAFGVPRWATALVAEATKTTHAALCKRPRNAWIKASS
jgi:hypothetical protein